MSSDVSFKKNNDYVRHANVYIFMSEVKQLNMQIYGAWLTVVSTTNWLNLSAQEVTDIF